MANLFGEIVEPESRAFWDDEDEEGSQIQFSLRWTKGADVPDKIKTLLILEGDAVTEFAKSCIVEAKQEVCLIDHGKFKPSLIFKITDELYICNIGNDLHQTHAGEFTEKIADILTRSEKIIAVACRHMSTFKGEDSSDAPSFLRSLATKNAECLLKNVPRLEQPNIVSGIVAGVISYAAVLDIPAVMYILYTDNNTLDSETAVPLIKLFSKIPNYVLQNSAFKRSKFDNNKGNLYI